MKRIIIVTIILVGSALIFRYWALNEFNEVFSTFDTPSRVQNVLQQATSTPAETKPIQNETPLVASVKFPTEKDTLYMGCTYLLKLETNQPINTMGLTLVDAGTRKPLGPVTSGLPKTLSEENISEISWKIGTFWPGDYVVELSNINNSTTSIKSKKISVEKFQANRTDEEKTTLCKQSGGTF